MRKLGTRDDRFGHFEFLLLTAIRQLGENASGTAIARLVSDVGGKHVSAGTVHLSLEPLEEDRYISSFVVTPASHGKPTQHFRLQARGESLLDELTETGRRVADAVIQAESRWRTRLS